MPVGITLKGQHEVMALNLLVTAAVGRVQGSRFLEVWWHVFHCCRANMGLAITGRCTCCLLAVTWQGVT